MSALKRRAVDDLKDRLEYDKHGRPEKGLRNVVQILRFHPDLKGAIRFDEFRRRKLRVKPLPWCEAIEPWRDVDVHAFREWVEMQFGLKSTAENAVSAIELVAWENRFDSLRDHVESLQWDQTPRVEFLLARYFGAEDSVLHREYSKRFLIQLIARAMRPGCKADVVLVLEGKQGARKSSGLRALVSGEYFSDDPLDFSSKDGMAAISETWLHEIAELDSFKRQEMTAVKAFLTKQRDRFRPAYGREIVDCDRRCVFAATTNESVYNDDSTGNRRFWGVACGTVDVLAIERDRDQLLAEARVLYAANHPWWFDASEALHSQVLESQAARQYDHPWRARLESWLSQQNEIDRRNGFTSNELIEQAIGISELPKYGKREFMILGDVMRVIGWSRTKNPVLRGNLRVRVWRNEPEFEPLKTESDAQPIAQEPAPIANDFSDLDSQLDEF